MSDKISLRNPLGVEPIIAWVGDNLDRLAMGALIAVAIVAVMLAVRWIGYRMAEKDPDCRQWRGIIGRMFAKTSIWFMVAAALEFIASYASMPAKLARLAD